MDEPTSDRGGVSVAVAPAPLTDTLPTTADARTYSLSSAKAQALVGHTTIPRRAEAYSVYDLLPANAKGSLEVPVPVFAEYSDKEVTSKLASAAILFFGPTIATEGPADHVSTFALPIARGMAWTAKGTGAMSFAKNDYRRGISRIANTQDAVNLALDHVAEAGLLTLAANESLDVLGVSSTRYAGWRDSADGKTTEPVMFDDGSGNLISEYKSEYMVRLGRRYRGIPIDGAAATVRLDAAGNMIAFHKAWRDIVGERPSPASLLAAGELEARRSAELAGLAEKSRRCGYIEADSIGYRQSFPGVGCTILYDNPEGRGTLGATRQEVISLTDDSALSVSGQRLLAD